MRIFVLVDFSLYTESLIKVASNWAEIMNAELMLIHEVPRIVPVMVDDKTRYTIIEYEKEEAISRLKALKEKSIPDWISVEFKVTEKRLESIIPQLKSQNEEVLIMLGLKGTGLLKKIFIGSVATKILDELNEITVGVPIKINQALPESLIIPVDPKYPVNYKRLDQLLEILKNSLKSIEFISIVKSDDFENRSQNYLKEINHIYENRISTSCKLFKSRFIFEEVKTYMEDRNKSFLVLQKGSSSMTDLTFRRFFINRVLHDGSIPLIVLPD